MSESWKDVLGYEGSYQVSDSGRVRSVDREITYCNGRVHSYKGKYLSLQMDKNGYMTAVLSLNNSIKVKKVHRMVGECFIPNPENKPQINHINGAKDDNLVRNLEWNTAKENMTHSYNTGLNKSGSGENSTSNKLSEIDVLFIKLWLCEGHQHRGLAKLFGVTFSNISCIHLGKSWKNTKI